MAPIGHKVSPTPSAAALSRARERARLLPDCLVEARRIANTVISGWHGRKKRGIGENFWQFRPFVEGDSITRIDWRRSARDDHTYIRDREWEAAHTIWLWASMSPSMMFHSKLGMVSKESRALVLMLATAEIVARSGERIGCPGVMEPIAARNAAERLAHALIHADLEGSMPDTGMIRGASEIVLFGDFLDPPDQTLQLLQPLSQRGLRGHIVEVSDPVEEDFPYSGRVEFTDPATGEKFLSGRSEGLREEYRQLYFARREALRDGCRHMGWNYIAHNTSRPASEALVAVHMYLSGQPGRAIGGAP
ncbi:MAG: hypothetical protein RLZZ444_419 [Pseudomonadota bacterium]